MPFRFGKKSKDNFEGVNHSLIICSSMAILTCPVDFMNFSGVRTYAEQAELVAKGFSWTMDSDHLDGNAVDLVPIVNGKLTWEDYDAFKLIGKHMRKAAKWHNIKILRWGANIKYGGDWYNRNDMAHFYTV